MDERRSLLRQLDNARWMLYRGAMLLIVAAFLALGAVAFARESHVAAAMASMLWLVVSSAGISITVLGVRMRRAAHEQLREVPPARVVVR